jgi:hypothetical protein
MSDNSNTELLERAYIIKEQYLGTYLPEAIDKAIEDNDLKRLEFMIREAELEQDKWEHQDGVQDGGAMNAEQILAQALEVKQAMDKAIYRPSTLQDFRSGKWYEDEDGNIISEAEAQEEVDFTNETV